MYMTPTVFSDMGSGKAEGITTPTTKRKDRIEKTKTKSPTVFSDMGPQKAEGIPSSKAVQQKEKEEQEKKSPAVK